MRITRRNLLATGGAAVMVGATGCESNAKTASDRDFILSPGGRELVLSGAGLRDRVRVWVMGDTHFGLHDGRDDAYAANYRRMAQWPGDPAAFEKMLSDAKSGGVDLLVLVGDIISFPTLANVEFVKRMLDESGVPWLYTAGNHDWHFEGDTGSDLEQRDRWIERRLMPLYPASADPLMYSRVVKGIRFVAIDNSAYLIRREQLEFWNKEAAKGDPTVLLMHIPLYVENWGVQTCGCPDWNAANDLNWEIERREKWRAEGPTPETFAFREAVLATPNLVGVFTGHIHVSMCAHVRGQNMFSVVSGRAGAFLDVRIG